MLLSFLGWVCVTFCVTPWILSSIPLHRCLRLTSLARYYFRALKPQHQNSYPHKAGSTVLISNPSITSETKCSKAAGKLLNTPAPTFLLIHTKRRYLTRFDPSYLQAPNHWDTDEREKDSLRSFDLVLIWKHLYLVILCMDVTLKQLNRNIPL